MHILYLADRPEDLDELARWHHDEWSQLRGGESLHECRRGLEATMTRDGFPVTVVAVDDDRLLGSASLVESAMETRPELTPWLAGVYVDAGERGRGIGSALIERIIDEAAVRDFDEIYLFTTEYAAWYERFGWETIDDDHYHGFEVTVMRLDS